MTGVRHFSASAIVFDDDGRVLLVHDGERGRWSLPGGHIRADEDPAQAVLRLVEAQTGMAVQIVDGETFTLPVGRVLAAPFAVIETDADDSEVGAHRHIDMAYVCRPGDAAEVAASRSHDYRWAPITSLDAITTSIDLSALVAVARRAALDPQPVAGAVAAV
ncbi:NUDIX domain-containing protein [Micromonospora ureilytica]|uniref:NUDIX domain-containing protein n=1 Tax=Micromonospora ureilytica TaxID=709868 RepID=UPI002E117F60|nr:NUDIX domain-containing protein [Micromonospora ureilytica]